MLTLSATINSNLSEVCSIWPLKPGQDCCKGFDFLWQLAWVYDTIKRIDPYHLTAGFAECGELHAFQEPHLSLVRPSDPAAAFRSPLHPKHYQLHY